MRTGLEDLPEPAELHARLSAHRPLDWGDPIPTKAEIAAQYGVDATRRSLTLLAQAAAAEDSITGEVLSSAGSETVAHQVESRVKSPQSLARKLRKIADTDSASVEVQLEDVLRYTFVTPQPDDLVTVAENACAGLIDRGWTMAGAMHSYADGSRYKGLHLFLQRQGQRVELQVHSRESIDVKHRTTPLYVVERDTRQPESTRLAARQEAIALSAQMRQPVGLDGRRTLGGAPLEVRVYGRRTRRTERGVGSTTAQAHPVAPKLATEQARKDGMSL